MGSDISDRETNGLARFSVHPDDSEEWNVGVIPSDAFSHLID